MVTTATPASAPARTQRAGAVPVAFTGSWPMVAGWGAGLILAALGAGGIIGPDGTLASRSAGAVLFLLGLSAFGWGIASLARSRLMTPRLVLAGVIAAVVTATTLLILAPAHTSVFAIGAATVLLLVIAGFAAVELRRASGPAPVRAASVWGMLLAAAVLSGIVTPALGATQDAVLIRDDGSIPVITHH